MKRLFDPFSSLTYLDPRSIKYMSDQIMDLIEKKLWAKILFAMVLGIAIGFLLSQSGPFAKFLSSRSNEVTTGMNWLGLPAKAFLRLIRMVIIPLILASIIRGLASTSNVDQIRKLGLRFGIFVFVNTALGAVLGVALVTLIQPGRALHLTGAKLRDSGVADGVFGFRVDSLLEFLPLNPLESIVGGDMLDVVVIALIGGIAVLSLERSQAKSVLDLFEIVQSICMNVISWAMKLAPYAVFGMMAQVAHGSGLKALQSMTLYLLTAFLGFAIFIVFYAVVIATVRRRSPVYFFKAIGTPMLLAFSTSSSAATMPVSMKAAEEDLDIEPTVARFLLPLGATVNMAGTAIWQTSAVLFLSQIYGIDLSYGEIMFVVATSIGSSIGSPGVPGVGMGVLATVLAKIGIPIEGVSLILGVDRLIDMGCTVVNVSGDLTAAEIFGGRNGKEGMRA